MRRMYEIPETVGGAPMMVWQTHQETIEQLFRKQRTRWRRVAAAFVHNALDAEDVIQIAILKTLKSNSRFVSPQKAHQYVQKAIYTTVVDFRKERARSRIVPVSDEELETIKAHLLDPLEVLIAKEEANVKQKLIEAVIDAFERLPSGQRMTIELHILNEKPLSILEISRRTGTPVSTLRSRMLAGLRKIRNEIERNGGVK